MKQLALYWCNSYLSYYLTVYRYEYKDLNKKGTPTDLGWIYMYSRYVRVQITKDNTSILCSTLTKTYSLQFYYILFIPVGPYPDSGPDADGWRTVIKRSRSGTRTPELRSWTSVTSSIRRPGSSARGASIEDRSRETYLTPSSSLFPPARIQYM